MATKLPLRARIAKAIGGSALPLPGPAVPETTPGFGGVPAVTEAAMAAEGMGTTQSFSPGRPLDPYQPAGSEPRAFDVGTGYNIATRPRNVRSRMSFDTLRQLIDGYDCARICINHRIDDVRSLDYRITAAENAQGDVDAAIAIGKAALKRPDGRNHFGSWLATWLEGVLRYDAGVLYRRRDLAGRVIALEVVDGTMIAPLVDYYGRRPYGEAPAFVQFANGIPWVQLRDCDLVYAPFRPQADSMYGLAPLESIILSANTDIRFQWYFLQYFTDGSVPAAYAEAPPDVTTPEQVADWQEYWDAAMEGDQAAKHKVRFVPAGTKITSIRDVAFSEDFPLYLMRKCCAAYGVTPTDLGFTETVNRATSDTQVDIQFRVGTKPLVGYCEAIINSYLQDDLGLPVVFAFDTGQEKDDRLEEANTWDVYIKSGVASVDEAREKLLGLPTDQLRPIPRFIFSPRTGAIPLAALLSIAGPTDPETLAPVSDQPLQVAHFTGAEGLLPDKAPGGTAFAMAPLNPDEPAFPQLEGVVPGSDVVAPPAPVQASLARPVRKSLVAAGLVVKAGDTGRVLMIQRALDPTDPASGCWEWPGGHIEGGESPLEAAKREWSEETGSPVPPGVCVGTWTSGIYQAFVWATPSEDVLNINQSVGRLLNPDDPDGDNIETCAWWDPEDLAELPSLRPECLTSNWDLIAAAGSPEVVKSGPKVPQSHWARYGEPLETYWSPKILDALSAYLAPLASAAVTLAARQVRKADVPPAQPSSSSSGGVDPAWRATFEAQLRSAAELNSNDLVEVLRGAYADASLAGGHAATTTLGGGVQVTPALTSGDALIDWDHWTPGNPAAAAKVSPGTFAFDETVAGMADTTTSRLVTAVSDGISSGASSDSIARSINGIINDPARSLVIARTTVADAMGRATLDTYRSNNVPRKRWLTSDPCDVCQANEDAGAIPVDEDFPSGDDAPPAHPNCRCAVAPVLTSSSGGTGDLGDDNDDDDSSDEGPEPVETPDEDDSDLDEDDVAPEEKPQPPSAAEADAAALKQASADLTSIRSDMRAQMSGVKQDAMAELDRVGVVRMRKPPPVARVMDDAGRMVSRSQTGGEWDWFYSLDKPEQARLRGSWLVDSDTASGPDDMAEHYRAAGMTGADDDAAQWWLNQTRRYDAAGGLARGKLPSAGLYGNLDIDELLPDQPYSVSKVFAGRDDAVGYIAQVNRTEAENFADRDWPAATHGPAPYYMTEAEWTAEIAAVTETANNAVPLSSGDEWSSGFSATDEAALARYDELIPTHLGIDNLSPSEQYAAIMDAAKAAGRVL